MAEESLTTQKGDEVIFPVADGPAKLSGSVYDFREPTFRREQTERREVLIEKLHSESGESQPTETADDAEACADFW